MNILFTTFCNLRCPYCFAKSKLQDDAMTLGECISLKDLAYTIDFVKRSGGGNVNVLGGEPTLHPQFSKAFSMLLKENFSSVSLFTNGLINEDTKMFLQKIRSNNWGMVLNVNAPGAYTKKQWRTVNSTAKAFGSRVTLSFNVHKPEPDMDFLVEFIKKNNTSPMIRIGLALPIFGGGNTYIAVKDYSKVAATLVRFAEKNYEEGVTIKPDCGFMLCSFTDQQLGKLARIGSHLDFYCGMPGDVGPGLRLWKCFPTSRIWNKKLTDFKDMSEIVQFYSQKTDLLRRMGGRDDCFRCKYMKLGCCSGGCLGHTLRNMKLEDKIGKM